MHHYTRKERYVSPKIGQEIIKYTRNKQALMWEVPLETQQSESVENNIMVKTNKPELAQYLREALSSPTTASLLKAIKQGFLKLGQASQKSASRSILKNQETQQWDT